MMRWLGENRLAVTLLAAALVLPATLPAAPPVAQGWTMTVPEASTNPCVLGFVINTGLFSNTVTLVAAPAQGTLLYQTNGVSVPVPVGTAVTNNQWLYAAPAGASGTNRFTWKVNDGTLDSAVATNTVIVTTNTTPVVSNTSVFLPRGGCVGVGLFTDPDAGQALASMLVTAPAHGTLRYRDAAGAYQPVALGVPAPGTQWIYKADSVYTGADVFAWTTSDGVASSVSTGSCAATITVNIPPVFNNLNVSGYQDDYVTLSAAYTVYESAFQDPALPSLYPYTVTTGPAHGIVYYQDPTNSLLYHDVTVGVPFTSSNIRYRPNPGFVGVDTFQRVMNDGMTNSNISTVTITVNSKALAANSQSVSTWQASVRYGFVLSSSVLNPISGVTFLLVTPPAHGVLESYANSTYLPVTTSNSASSRNWCYTPSPEFSGADSFVWQVTDGVTTSGLATASITVAANTPPTANSQSVTNLAGAVTGMVLPFSEPDAYQTMSFTLVTAPTHGALKVNTNYYTSAVAGYADISASVPVSSPQWLYTPSPLGYTGPDSFTWTVSDGIVTSAPATCSITVVGNSAPVLASTNIGARANMRNQYQFAYTHSAVDSNAGQVVTFMLISPPRNGTLVNFGASGSMPAGISQTIGQLGLFCYYTPNPGYTGADSYVWQLFDGVDASAAATCSITVSNTVPVARSGTNTVSGGSALNAITFSYTDTGETQQPHTYSLVSLPANGTLSTLFIGPTTPAGIYFPASAGSPFPYSASPTKVYYTPSAGFAGTDTFVWAISDGLATGTATNLVVVNANAVPVIANPALTLTVLQDSTNNLQQFFGYTHTDVGQTISFGLASEPAHGTVTAAGVTLHAGNTSATNAWVYCPAAGYTGSDSFSWTISDGMVTTTPATVSITVVPTPAPHTQPVFKAGVKLQNGGQTLQLYRNLDPTSGLYIYGNPAATVYAMAAPEVVDWNNDGLSDLLVGQADGRVALFLNKGTRGNPVFDGFTYLKLLDGTYIWGYTGCNCDGGGPACTAPRVVDWNNDGKKDLLLGQWAGPFFNQPMYVCLNSGTDANPAFSNRVVLTTTFLYSTMSPQQPYTMPFVADWNGDGISDLIAGDNSMWGPTPNYLGYPSLKAASGAINIWLGTSNNHWPATLSVNTMEPQIPQYVLTNSFASASPSFSVTGACPVMSRKSVVLTDWTGNGVKDLVVGTQDGVVWYAPNAGTVNYPVFTNYYPVMAGGTNVVVGNPAKAGWDSGYEPSVNSVLWGQHMPYINEARIAVADLDGDGLQDLVVGDVYGTVTFYAQYNPNPVAIDGRVRVIQNTATPVTLASRVDSGHAVTATVTRLPAYGTLSGSGTNRVYTPTNSAFTGTDSFSFVLADGALVSRTGTVTLLVNNLPPVAASQVGHDTALVLMNSNRTVTLAATDPGNAPLTYSVVTPPAHGGVAVVSNTATYTPAAGYLGPDSFTFKANDGVLDSSPATVALEVVVLAVNFQPSGRPVPAGYVKDDGSVFDAGRGYGWDTSCTNAMVWRDLHPDARLDTLVSLSTSTTWRCNLSNGNYFVTMSFGDFGNDQCGPHQVSVQGGASLSKRQKVSCPTMIAGSYSKDQFIRFDNIPAAVTNGQLTVSIGDGTNLTCLDYLEIRTNAKVSGAATFVAEDATTQGSWKGVYGSEGRWIINSYIHVPDNFSFDVPLWARSIPSYAWFLDPFVYDVSFVVWTNSTTDPRALQNAWDSGRAASSLVGSKYTTEQVGRLTFLDGAAHRVALYCLDWDTNCPSQTIDILDAGDNVIDSRTVSAFTGGKYLVWDLSGDVKIRLPGQGRMAAILFGAGGLSLTAGGAPTSGYTPLAVQFTATGSEPGSNSLAYFWTFGDGATSTNQNPLHTYTNAGSFTAWVTASYGGSSATASVPVSVASSTRTLTVGVSGTGTGTVTLDPPGGTYLTNAVVTVTAVPGSNSLFSGWNGALTGTTNPATITMDTDHSVTATFTFDGFVINASAGANGSISPSGTVSVVHGASQLFTMTPAAWYAISNVTVDGVSSGAVSSVGFDNVATNHAVTVSFMPLLAPHGTPQWWLAQYGWTNDFAAAELGDPDGDGVVTWREYLAGAIPTNPLSRPAYNTVPYAESFENLAGWGGGYTNVSARMGWSSGPSGSDQSRITNLVYTFNATNLPLPSATHTNVLRLDTQGDVLTNSFGSGYDMGGAVVYMDLMMRLLPVEQVPAPFTAADTGTKCGVYANVSNQLVVYHGVAAPDGTLLSNAVDATTVVADSNNWHRVTLVLDATATNPASALTMFQVKYDGLPVTNPAAYGSGWKAQFEATGLLPSTVSTGSWFRLATTNAAAKTLQRLCFMGSGYADDVVTTTLDPFASGGTFLLMVTRTGRGTSSLGVAPFVSVPVSAGATTQIVYQADDWYRISTLAVNGVAAPAATGARAFTQVVANISADISNAVAFTQATAAQAGTPTNVPVDWLTNWTEVAVSAGGGDGYDLAGKYMLGLDPTSSNTYLLKVDSLSVAGSNVIVAVRRVVTGALSPDGMHGYLVLQGAANLGEGFTNIAATAITGATVFDGAGRRIYTNAVDGSNRFYKAVVTP